MRFSYLDWGREGLPPMLFLHGGGLTSRTWDLVCLALRQHHRCIALDQRGHGDSEWSPTMEYSWQAHVGDLEAFVDALELRGLILAGMSMGGLIAIGYAGRHSGHLAGLVAIDIGPEPRQIEGNATRAFLLDTAEVDSVEEFVQKAAAFNPHRDVRLLRRSVLHNLRELPSGRWARKNDTRHLVQQAGGVASRPTREIWNMWAKSSAPF